MGLDMYLTASRYVSGYSFERSPEVKKAHSALVKAAGLKKGDVPEGHAEVSFTVAYWRKANQIHSWFVKRVQKGQDDCQKHSVSIETLEILRASCQGVLDSHKSEQARVAKSLLPTQGGFFFGSTNYDENYIEDLKETINQLDRNILKNPRMKNDWCFYYQSSW